MYAKVAVIKSTPEPLWYVVPEVFSDKLTVGSWVQVSVRNSQKYGIVKQVQLTRPTFSRDVNLKSIMSLVQIPDDSIFEPLLSHIARLYFIDEDSLRARIHGFLAKEAISQRNVKQRVQRPACSSLPRLTEQQSTAYEMILPSLEQGAKKPFVLHGVTGSGKTEIYKRLIVEAYTRGKTTIFMVPEVTLALAFEIRFMQQLAQEIPIFSFHSASTSREKRMLWHMACAGAPCVIIGVHLPILLPLQNLGLIIVDEEHDPGYQEKKHPKLHSRIIALMRAHLAQIPIVLGSATPSMHTLHGVQTRGWSILRLTERFSGNFPEIEIVNLLKDRYRKQFWISKELQNAIKKRLEQKEQIIIFLNRRGYSFFVQCKVCAQCLNCHACSVSLTLHQTGQLICHYCGYTQALPMQCPACKAPEKELLKRGIGTQQVVSLLQRLFPEATIGRADLDVTKKKTAWRETLEAFASKKLDIIVGTQTITKGYDFPGVTLVGVIWADMQLHAPSYSATETTIAQLIQVAGRAGRHSEHAMVIMQVMQDNPAFVYLNEQAFTQLYDKECQDRSELNYPPCARAVSVELYHAQEQLVTQEVRSFAQQLMVHATDASLTVLGPSLPPVAKIKNIYSRTILLKAADFNVIIAAIQHAKQSKKWVSSICCTPLW